MARRTVTFSIPETLLTDVEVVRRFVRGRSGDEYVQDRISENVSGPAPAFDRERFWWVAMGCLLTTQQRSTRGSRVDRFHSQVPFPLTTALCGMDVERVVRQTLTGFGGIRMAPTIARRADANYQWLERGGWIQVQSWFESLAKQRSCPPESRHFSLEREVAHASASVLWGFGPKQSRNLWQWLGLTRYETPLDSRVAKWINSNLSLRVEVKKLVNGRYYDSLMDWLRQLCQGAGALPCVFDAAAFDNYSSLQIKNTKSPYNCACLEKAHETATIS